MKIRIAGLLFLLGISAHAEDWTTSDGKTYKNITVVGHDPVSVSIWYDGGSATLSISTLPPEIQQRLGYSRGRVATAHDMTVSAPEPTAPSDSLSSQIKAIEDKIAALQTDKARATNEAKAEYDAYGNLIATHGGAADQAVADQAAIQQLLLQEAQLKAQGKKNTGPSPFVSSDSTPPATPDPSTADAEGHHSMDSLSH